MRPFCASTVVEVAIASFVFTLLFEGTKKAVTLNVKHLDQLQFQTNFSAGTH